MVRLTDDRIPKQLLFGELATLKRPNHKPTQRFKDSLKDTLKKVDLPVVTWENLVVQEKGELRQLTHEKMN